MSAQLLLRSTARQTADGRCATASIRRRRNGAPLRPVHVRQKNVDGADDAAFPHGSLNEIAARVLHESSRATAALR